MLNMKATETAYEHFLEETAHKRLPKTAADLFARIEKELRSLDTNESDGFFPATATAFFRMLKIVNRSGLRDEFYVLMADIADICEKGTQDELRILGAVTLGMRERVCFTT